jgi:hypothetical protein
MFLAAIIAISTIIIIIAVNAMLCPIHNAQVDWFERLKLMAFYLFGKFAIWRAIMDSAMELTAR